MLPGVRPDPDGYIEKPGALSECPNPGLHRQAAKIDVASLYPSIMLRYGLCSRKDPERKFLGVMQYMTQERLRLKQLAKSGNLQAHHEQNALKILINGSYGYFGTEGYSFNDPSTMALVAGYGRKILGQMVRTVEAYGATVIEYDTDGIIFTHSQPEFVTEQVQQGLPAGIRVELEFKDVGICVPKKKSSVVVYPNGEIKCKGLFRKRDRYWLYNEFPVQFLQRYFNQSPQAAEEYYQTIRAALQEYRIPLEQLTVTSKIRVNEKAIVDRGLGKPGDRVSYYWSEQKCFHVKTNKPIKSRAVHSGISSGDSYWAHWYVKELDKRYQEIAGKGADLTATDQLQLLEEDND